jgi:hypothetical protein
VVNVDKDITIDYSKLKVMPSSAIRAKSYKLSHELTEAKDIEWCLLMGLIAVKGSTHWLPGI